MSNNNVINEKKKALLTYKEKILDEIKYYERSVDEFYANYKNKSNFEDVYSSDSEDEFPCAIDTGPAIPQLKLQQSMLKTCLHATQELTSLMILQSESTVLVEEPKFEGENPVAEYGTWREVTAECRIDLVPFTISFFMHTPDRKFAPPSYRGLRVVPVKYAHEMELSKSVLHTLKLPSDAVEVLRSYAVSYRSRRTSLARLANKYANSLFMEPHPEGGFVLKCVDLLEMSWRLENKWSPVAPFHHRMKFDLEYMDEVSIKTITQAHKQLLDPSIETDERTLLLAKIISTCLEVRGPIDSDLESKTEERDEKRDSEISEVEKRDSEVMAPPKSLPKKPKKSKGSNVGQKRSMQEEDDDNGAKRMKNNDLPIDGGSKKGTESEGPKKSINNAVNPRKTKSNDVVHDVAKKSKPNDASDKNVNKVASSKNVKEPGNTENRDSNTKAKTAKVIESNKNDDGSQVKNKKSNVPANTDKGDSNNKPRNAKGIKNNEQGDGNQVKNKKSKDPENIENIKPKNKNVNNKDNVDGDGNNKPKNKITKDNVKNINIKDIVKTKNTKEPGNIENKVTKPQNKKELATKEVTNDNIKTKTKNLKDSDNTAKAKDKPKSKVVKTGSNEEGSGDAKSNNKKEKATGNAVQEKEIEEEKSDTKNNKIKESMTVQDKDNLKLRNQITKDPSSVVGKTKKAAVKNADDTEKNKDSDSQPKNFEKKKAKSVASSKNIDTQADDIEKNKDNDNQPKNFEKKKSKTVAISKNIDTNKNIANDLPKNSEQTNKATVKMRNVANVKTTENNSKKTENIAKTATTAKQSVANPKNDNQIKKVPDKNVKKSSDNIKPNSTVNLVKNNTQIVKKVTEKNATNIRNKDKISPIDNDRTFIKETAVPNKVNYLLPKKTITSKPIKNTVASHRNTLKAQNLQKNFKAGNTGNVFKSNTEKENGQKISKIPQKKMSPISESSSRKNLLRISPRKIPSKFKTSSQETLKLKMMKTTNIPRLMKKPMSKT